MDKLVNLPTFQKICVWMAWQLLDLHDDIIATMLHMGTSCGQDDSKIHLDNGMKISQPMHYWHQDLHICSIFVVL